MKIKYVNKFVEVDFFHSIGRLGVEALRKDWYADESGNVSPRANEIFLNEDEWHKRYWKTFESTITTKLEDWQHEGEDRLILHSMLRDVDDPVDRKLVYDISDLAGIIFGINTPMDDRMNIVRVISEKCKAIGTCQNFCVRDVHSVARTRQVISYPSVDLVCKRLMRADRCSFV